MKEQRYTWDFNTILNVQKECLEEVKNCKGFLRTLPKKMFVS